MNRILITGKNADFTLFLPPRETSQWRGNLAPSNLEGAPSFDLTAEQWIVPPSRMMRDAVAPAGQARPVTTHARSYPSYLKPSPVVRPLEAAGRLELVIDVMTVALGLTVFGVIAGVFLLLA
jgi:hypothetical protein